MSDFFENEDAWAQVFPEVCRTWNLQFDEDELFPDKSYFNAIRYKRMLPVKGCPNTVRIITEKGIMTLIRAASSEWDWKGHAEYWPLEYHRESLFNQPVPHLKNVFFFRPQLIARNINSGKYRVYIRQAIDVNCNLEEAATLKIDVKDSTDTDSYFMTVHEVPFIPSEQFEELLDCSPHLLDCLVAEFNFEESCTSSSGAGEFDSLPSTEAGKSDTGF